MNQATSLGEPEVWQSHLQTLHREFYETANDQCLLWVNPAQGDPFGDDPLVKERMVRVPINHRNFDVKLAPYLIPLDISKSADADLFKTSVRMAWDAWTLDSLQAYNGQPIAGWAVTDETPAALARYWATHCHLHVVNRLNKLLRFHDPSVREWLWPVLTPTQQRQLLGPLTKVIALNRAQELMKHRMGNDTTPETERDIERLRATSLKLILTPEQWEQVNDYANVHSAWLRCCGADPGFRATLAQTSAWEKETFSALKQATLYGINDPQDRHLFAIHALQLRSSFHSHNKLQAVWKMTRAGEYYGGACEKVSSRPADLLHTYL